VKRIDKYLLGQSLPPLLFGLLLYSTLAVISTTLPRLQWMIGVPIPELLTWLGLLYPNAIVQTLPIAIVLAVLLAFGRLAADRELLAMQAGAISLGRASAIFIVLGFLAAGASLALNQWVLPWANAQVGGLYWQLTSNSSGLWRLTGQSIPVDNLTIHFDRVDRATDEVFDVRIERWDDRSATIVFAERARFEERGLRLYGYRTVGLDFSALDDPGGDAEELLGRLVRSETRGAGPEASLLLTLSTSQEELVTRFSEGGFNDTRSITESYAARQNEALPAQERRQAHVLLHRQLAEPFASVVLLLVAMPLALKYARGRGVAFGLSLVVTLVWYLLLTLGQLWAQAGTLPVPVGVWLANIVLGFIGVVLLSRRVEPS